MEYLLKASAVVAIFYLCYKVFLQRDTFFVSNRWFLLLGLLTAFLIPFFVIPIYVEYTPLDLYDYTFNASVISEPTEQNFNILDYLSIIYGLGVAFFSIRFIIQLVSLIFVIIKNKGEKNGAYIFIKTCKNESPFSFFNWIVFNPNQFSETELEQIIAHEKIHVNQRHSFDILLTYMSCIILWFNPFIWLYIKDLKQNLEFIADSEASKQSTSKKSYQYTLLKTSMPSHQMALSNPFYNSLIKKRIVMLHKSKSKKINLIKYALVIPLLAGFLMSFNTEEVYIEKITEKTTNGTIENKLETQKTINTDTLKIIFNKDLSDKDLEKIKSNLKENNIIFTYSELKRNAKGEIISIATKYETAEGNCTSNVTGNPIKPFYYFRSGTTSGVGNLEDEKLKNSIKESEWKTKSISEEEMIDVKVTGYAKTQDSVLNRKIGNKTNVINNEDELNPWKITIGRNAVSYPDTDTLKWKSTNKRVGLNWVSEEDKKVSLSNKNESNVKFYSSNSKEPLYFIDGKESKKNEMDNLQHYNIESINVLKDDMAIEKYGEKAKNGVIEVTTKKNPRSEWKISAERNTNVIYAKKDTIYVQKKPDLFKELAASKNNQPLYILNGKEISRKELGQLNELNIESVSEIKDSKYAIEKYGEKGKYGVVQIKTRTDNSKTPIVKVIGNAIYILDGKEVKKEVFDKLNPDDIESVNVLKGNTAIKKYGEKAKNGVVEITTKK